MQTTIKQVIKCEGIGLHSGSNVSLMIKPSAAEYGIWFRRTDVKNLDNMIEYSKINSSKIIFITQMVASHHALVPYLQYINQKTLNFCLKEKIECFDLHNKIKFG